MRSLVGYEREREAGKALSCSPCALTWVGVCQKRNDRQEDFGDGERRAPVILEHVKTDSTRAIHVAVVDTGSETELKKSRREERRTK